MLFLWFSAACTVICTVAVFALSLFAQGSAEADRWIAPVGTSIVNLAATVIAWLTARDRLKYDSSHAIKDAKIADLEKDNRTLEDEAIRIRRRVSRLAVNLLAVQQGKPMPYPLELGFSTDEDPSPQSGT